MASFNLKYRKTYSARSISLPARAHPLTQRLEEQVQQFKSSEATSTSSSSIDHNLVGLKDLLDCVHDLLQLPAAQKVLARERSDKSISQVLDRSLRVLDVCSTTRDSLLQIKECAQDLQSALRRRRGGEHGFQKEVATCEMEKVDMVVSQLFSSKSCKAIEAKHITNALKQLDALDRGINDLESSLECVYKSLIKARVALLNILSQE